MARELKPCGTRAAYTRHYRNGEPIDDACREAFNAYTAGVQRRTGSARARQRAFAQLGRRYPEALKVLCDQELAKETERDNAAWRRARMRAFTTLTKHYPEAWADLFAKEKAKESRS